MKSPRRLFKNRPARDDRDILAACLSVEVFTLAAKMLACWLVAPNGKGMDGDRARSAFRDMVRHSLDKPWGTSGKLPFPDQRTQETVYAAMVAAAEDAIARGIDAIPEVTTEDEVRRYAGAQEIAKW